ncbi:uncharacterized protein LOC126739322 [Anthonomus grandis grandis]|uniref:uncharacterized protein LOC126739322 n=1 Tax=Anthonomus grandis grandis TaxID=2921223 RepID=UPI0021657C40|nr:uncharacterized protein LOC126739322 [Anthonomus grandis grandis]
MKNGKESKEKVQRSSSSTSEVVESIDLTLLPTASIEPHLLLTRPSGSSNSSYSLRDINSNNADKIATDLFEVALNDAIQRPTTSELLDQASSEDRRTYRLTTSQPNLRGPNDTDFQVMRTNAGGAAKIHAIQSSQSDNTTKRTTSKRSLNRIPPSYSTVLKLGPPITHFDSSTYPSIPFITRQPPPSYAEVHGWDDNPSIISAESYSLGPNPLYISCPRCRTVVVSDIHTERTHVSYILAIVMCLCLCWPCAVLPLCLKSCRNTYHFCPTCNYYLGVYRPC